MKVNRNFTSLIKMADQDDCYVDASPEECVSVIWEITAELWSLKDRKIVERRLQRNVTNLIKQQS